jgi:hypothetical protein
MINIEEIGDCIILNKYITIKKNDICSWHAEKIKSNFNNDIIKIILNVQGKLYEEWFLHESVENVQHYFNNLLIKK